MRPRRTVVVLLLVTAAAAIASGCGSDSTSPARRPSAPTATGPVAPATSSSAPTGTKSQPADCASAPSPERLLPEVLAERPHDPTAFTEGLLLVDGVLYESTGMEGASTVRAVDPRTGAVLRRTDLDPSSFGEGLTSVGRDRLVQLTWKEGRAFLWNRSDLRPVGELHYGGEGWGITTLDDGRLVMSDGSDHLTVRDPADFSVLDRFTVLRSDGRADQLNELEWDGTHLWANRWRTDEIVRIDLRCRRVDAVVDATQLRARAGAAAGSTSIDVLNGIAHEAGTDRYLLTGKDWPLLFEVRFVAVGGA